MNDKRYVLKEHPNGQYWKIIDTATGHEYSKIKAVDLLNEYEDMLLDTEHELEELDENIRIGIDELKGQYGLETPALGHWQLTVDGKPCPRIIFDSKIMANALLKVLNDLMKEKEYYRDYALKYLLGYDLFSDDFLETLESIEGRESVDRIRENQKSIITALRSEDLW